MIDYYQVAGYGGVAFYLGSYGLLQLGVLRGNSYTYAALNLLAAALVLVSLFRNWNLFSAIIQISWRSPMRFPEGGSAAGARTFSRAASGSPCRPDVSPGAYSVFRMCTKQQMAWSVPIGNRCAIAVVR